MFSTILIGIGFIILFAGVVTAGFGIVGLNGAKDDAAKSFAMKRVAWGGGLTLLGIVLFFVKAVI